jgi:hypothetical protein
MLRRKGLGHWARESRLLKSSDIKGSIAPLCLLLRVWSNFASSDETACLGLSSRTGKHRSWAAKYLSVRICWLLTVP